MNTNNEIPTICPKCGGRLVKRQSEKGEFLGCENYPKCNYVYHLYQTATVREITVFKDSVCPVCGANLALKEGRFGYFIGCVMYPNCDYIYQEEKEKEEACPICKTGFLQRRLSKSGRSFYGCSNYPSCSFVLQGKPYAHICPTCSFPLMYIKKKNGVSYLVCGNSLCSSRKKRSEKLILDENNEIKLMKITRRKN